MNTFWPENRLEEDGKKLGRGAIDARVQKVEMKWMRIMRDKWMEGRYVGGWERRGAFLERELNVGKRVEKKGPVKEAGWIWQEGRRGWGKAKLPRVLQADCLSRQLKIKEGWRGRKQEEMRRAERRGDRMGRRGAHLFGLITQCVIKEVAWKSLLITVT